MKLLSPPPHQGSTQYRRVMWTLTTSFQPWNEDSNRFSQVLPTDAQRARSRVSEGTCFVAMLPDDHCSSILKCPLRTLGYKDRGHFKWNFNKYDGKSIGSAINYTARNCLTHFSRWFVHGRDFGVLKIWNAPSDRGSDAMKSITFVIQFKNSPIMPICRLITSGCS